MLIDMDLKPAAFITYMGLSYGVLTPAKSISKAIYALKKGNAAAERVYELIDSENEFESQKVNDIKSFKQKIEMKNISFNIEYLTPTGLIGFSVLFIGLIFTGVMFYFVFFRLNEDDDSYKDRKRKKLENENQKQKIARLYPKGKYY
mgnify:CR=1 FL=1